ncbi:MAG: response regulator [Candidatus Sulfopaludibacter sp.]|nr:response regulator [Candidatus Sulfopaludibacter sp.]
MPAAPKARKKILVVEDEGLIADDIRRRLERLGYSVPAIASSGEEALGLARSQSFDLVLMDIRLKGEMDGIAVAEQLQRDHRAPVVYLTAHADQDTVSRATVTEPFGYILKPIADGNLRSTVQIALYKHELERRLRVSEAWLSTTLRSIGDGIVATDTNGEVVFLNAAAERLTGWLAGEAKGRALMEILALHDEPSGEPACNPVFDLLPDETRIYQLASRTGQRVPVEVECFENRDEPELLGAIVALRDIRDRKEQEELQIQAQRMDAIAALAGGVARDFDGVLAGLQAQVEDLYAHLSGEEREQAGRIRQTASRTAALASHLSALSRPGPLLVEAIGVNEAIRDAADALSLCLGPDIKLECELHPCSGFIQADRNRFRQVLVNLALHAREAMPGGTLRMETAIVDLDAGEAAARRCRGQWFVRLRVTEPGVASDAARLSAIFEPRFTGSRFGLAIAHRIVVQGGGHIQAFGEAGKGTSFEILWPCIGTYRGIAGLVGRDRSRDPIPTILVIEEEDAVRRAMERCLEEEGYRVLSAKTTGHAETVTAAYPGTVALLVADSSAAPLAERCKIPATLYLSGYRHDRPADPGVLWKPFPIGELQRRVRALVGK